MHGTRGCVSERLRNRRLAWRTKAMAAWKKTGRAGRVPGAASDSATSEKRRRTRGSSRQHRKVAGRGQKVKKSEEGNERHVSFEAKTSHDNGRVRLGKRRRQKRSSERGKDDWRKANDNRK